jgi:hypothetical protein
MKLRFILIAVSCHASLVLAYDVPIHKSMTKKAFAQAIDQNDFLVRLGLKDDKTAIAGMTPSDHAGKGAVDEDNGVRPLNHFFDPVPADGLVGLTDPNGLCFSMGAPAYAWGLESQFLNSYTLADVYKYQLNFLTGPNPGVRDSNGRFLFETVGHLVHLVQDMAQPEHTRNDQHLPYLKGTVDGYPYNLLADTAPGLYEEWTLNNLNLDDRNRQIECASCYYEGYALVKLPAYRDYFFTSASTGMANYSNYNFVTQDTNYGDYSNYWNPLTKACFQYAFPREADASVRVDYVSERVLRDDGTCCRTEPDILEHILTSHPHDFRTGTDDVDAFHAVLSSVDLETKKYVPGSTFYSLTDSSYQTRAALLIPRAVGYSAGFIDHMFRGKIGVTWTAFGEGTYHVTITNQSAEKIGADARLTANFVAKPEYFGRTNSDDTAPIFDGKIADYATGFSGLDPGQDVTISVSRPTALKPGDDLNKLERRIAVVGTLGSESGAVIGLVQPGGQKGLVFEMTWDGTFFVDEAIYDYPFTIDVNQRYTQACALPSGTTCSIDESVPNSKILIQKPGLLRIVVNPIPAGTTYRWDASLSSREDRQIHGTVLLDGKVISEQDYTIPGCVTVGYCSRIVSLGFYP